MAERSHKIGLSTDLYQMTMGASYHALDITGLATFSLFVRRLPPERGYLVAAGLDEALSRLESIRFDEQALAYLRSIHQVRPDFVDSLRDFRFSGDVWAVPEGRIIFADEPLLEVQGTIVEAQVAETILLNALHYSTMVASKAARCISAAPGKSLIEFGLRRTPSVDAGLAAARSAFIVGFTGTSNLLAGEQFGIPVAGTVAHSFIEIFPTELDAFRAFGWAFPGDITLLIDTYDTLQGARNAAIVAKELMVEDRRVLAVRIDSGDLITLSKQVRAILDADGLSNVGILASGGLTNGTSSNSLQTMHRSTLTVSVRDLAPRRTLHRSIWSINWCNLATHPSSSSAKAKQRWSAQNKSGDTPIWMAGLHLT